MLLLSALFFAILWSAYYLYTFRVLFVHKWITFSYSRRRFRASKKKKKKKKLFI